MIHKNDTFWYNKINFREGIENMKKIVLIHVIPASDTINNIE